MERPFPRRLELVLFAAALLAYAWFHQGGGWSQNGRYAMVRAIVERGRVSVDDFLIYRAAGTPGRLTRAPVEDGTFERDGHRVALTWQAGMSVTGAPVVSESIPVGSVGVTGDLVFARGRFHPNKAPGTALAAVPGYALVRGAMALSGVDPDTPKALAVGAWMTGVLSVGLLAAIGVVLFHRIARGYVPERPRAALLATAAFAFGTMAFPYATMLFEHDVVAASLVIALYALHRARSGTPAWAALAGFAAGWAAISNYVTAVVVAILGVYLVATVRRRPAWIAYAAGVLVPLLVVCAYNQACFGTPFTTNYAAQNPMFKTPGAWLGVFVTPRFGTLVATTFSPFRGLFVSSPVLLAGLYGLVRMLRDRRHRADGRLAVSITAFYLLFSVSFDAWHGGNTVGPRYLVPAVPFLALGLPLAIERLPRITAALAGLSIATNLLVTAVDPQAPIVSVPGRPLWRLSPLTEYELPLFVSGGADPLIDAVVEATARQIGTDPRTIRERIARGEERGFPLPLIRGPVSANPIGMYEGWFHMQYPPGSAEARFNSFNVGELVVPDSRASLVPLLVLEALLWLRLRGSSTSRRDRGGR